MRMRWFATFIAAVLLLLDVQLASAERRIALVVGNDDYEHVTPLSNAVNDARSVTAALRELGFTVIGKENLRRIELVDAVSDFAAHIARDDIALFFYAGHGVSLNGANYILPIDVSKPRATGRDEEARLTDNALAEERVLDRMRNAGARVALVVLDACRNNPLATPGGRSIGMTRGLAAPTVAEGLMSIYSAGSGQEALDRLGDWDHVTNSVFTRIFVEVVKTPGLDIQTVARETRRRVSELAKSVGHVQTPAVYEQIDGEVFLAGPPIGSSQPAIQVAGSQQSEFDAVMEAGTAQAFDAFLAKYPTGPLANIARRERERLNGSPLNPPRAIPPRYPPQPGETQAQILASPHVVVPDTWPQASKPASPLPTISAPATAWKPPDEIASRGETGCLFIGRVFGLDPYGDNFLSVRMRPNDTSGPALETDRLFDDHELCVTRTDGRWLFVLYRHEGSDKLLSGWVFDRYIRAAQGSTVPMAAASPTMWMQSAPVAPWGESGCLFTGRVFGLDRSGDNFLSVRAGPKSGAGRVPETDRLFDNHEVCVTRRDGHWLFVLYRHGGSDKMFSGWVFDRYISRN